VEISSVEGAGIVGGGVRINGLKTISAHPSAHASNALECQLEEGQDFSSLTADSICVVTWD